MDGLKSNSYAVSVEMSSGRPLCGKQHGHQDFSDSFSLRCCSIKPSSHLIKSDFLTRVILL